MANINLSYAIHEIVSLISYSSLDPKAKIDFKRKILTKRINFVLCEFCFWCASSIYIDLRTHFCPVCGNRTNSLTIRSEDNDGFLASNPIKKM